MSSGRHLNPSDGTLDDGAWLTVYLTRVNNHYLSYTRELNKARSRGRHEAFFSWQTQGPGQIRYFPPDHTAPPI